MYIILYIYTHNIISRGCAPAYRKADVRLPGKGNSNSHGARSVY